MKLGLRSLISNSTIRKFSSRMNVLRFFFFFFVKVCLKKLIKHIAYQQERKFFFFFLNKKNCSLMSFGIVVDFFFFPLKNAKSNINFTVKKIIT